MALVAETGTRLLDGFHRLHWKPSRYAALAALASFVLFFWLAIRIHDGKDSWVWMFLAGLSLGDASRLYVQRRLRTMIDDMDDDDLDD